MNSRLWIFITVVMAALMIGKRCFWAPRPSVRPAEEIQEPQTSQTQNQLFKPDPSAGAENPQVPLAPSNSKDLKATNPATNTQTPSAQEDVFLSKEEFSKSFQKKPFEEWHKESRPLGVGVDVLPGGLNLGHEAGVIATANGEIEYRYDVSYLEGTRFGPESCVSLKTSGKEPVMGVMDQGTLKFYQLPIQNAHYLVIRDKYFLILYHDSTKSRNLTETNQPRDPFETNQILFYSRQHDGSIRYQGQLAKYIYPDPQLTLRGIEYCELSYKN